MKLTIMKVMIIKRILNLPLRDKFYLKFLFNIISKFTWGYRVNNFGFSISKYGSLYLLELNRKIVKTSIMIKVYNVSQYSYSNRI
jgi:hypothetical protein